MFPGISFPVTVCVVCYGPYHELADRCFRSLREKTDPNHFRLRIGLNAVCSETRTLAREIAKEFPSTVLHESEQNLYKAGMMRRLFHEPPLESRWTIWFDDDSHVLRSDWLTSLAVAIEVRPEIAMWGKTYIVEVDEGIIQFLRAAPWYRGIPFSTDGREAGGARIGFAAGGWWALRTECIQKLQWPDPRLIQHHEDYILGEALRQSGYPCATFLPGVAINDAPRRAPANTPFGFNGYHRAIPPP